MASVLTHLLFPLTLSLTKTSQLLSSLVVRMHKLLDPECVCLSSESSLLEVKKLQVEGVVSERVRVNVREKESERDRNANLTVTNLKQPTYPQTYLSKYQPT